MRLVFSLPVLIGLMVLSGCQSPKEASKENFTKVLNDYHQRNCVMLSSYDFQDFPITIKLLPVQNRWANKQNPERTVQYDVLVDAGLLQVKDGETQDYENAFSRTKITVPTKTYQLSEAGSKAFAQQTGKGVLSSEGKRGFCAGYYHVTEISNFSEPAASMGYTISNVNYRTDLEKVQPWARNARLLEAYPHFAKALQSPQSQFSTLVLMNDGWVHEREMRP
ncbi:MAG: hypothetical protein JXR44_08685 [Thiotrichales bacterium]|nr:hypothetical protein [Thiotrichales bacterium]